MKIYILLLFLILSCCKSEKGKITSNVSSSDILIEYDSHVHIMSPFLIKYWKELGIPFSKSEVNYSNIDTILVNTQAKFINLIGMGYVYGNPEYYSGEDGFERLKVENTYLLTEASKYPNKVKPFFTIDPLKLEAISEINRCYNLNHEVGLKLHFNASQVYLTEPEHLTKIKLIFSTCAKLDIPILLHFDNWHPKFGKVDIDILVNSILEEIPSIKLQIAHFGTSGGFSEKTKLFLEAYLELRENNKIPKRHKIIFDISAVALDKDSEGISQLNKKEFIELREFVDKLGLENIVFGTDYPLYNGDEYLNVLRDKLEFTNEEIKSIMKNVL